MRDYIPGSPEHLALRRVRHAIKRCAFPIEPVQVTLERGHIGQRLSGFGDIIKIQFETFDFPFWQQDHLEKLQAYLRKHARARTHLTMQAEFPNRVHLEVAVDYSRQSQRAREQRLLRDFGAASDDPSRYLTSA